MKEVKKIKLDSSDRCPACGKPFLCSKSGKCWCYELYITESQREEITAKYDRCICPECLQGLSPDR
ncbi:MAG: cysteine-rich CWC family protein [Bacteroidales bacterium]|nr:cysteine-rich CWC family protein [Bacteroidales bacterium]